ncbi:hypothetical protein BCR34DRAFT_604749 [Clohesyomyces aquaticus]|uniref:Uncharacterized protein n=1 Tax=Clohesyomyces aquaticus TaxID=1231657 RepID=A0A1Y1Z2X6_9PLEO|nr:hypothetical protein BCR34DRAFT_604749 [Clohesyomyces aquaticus]
MRYINSLITLFPLVLRAVPTSHPGGGFSELKNLLIPKEKGELNSRTLSTRDDCTGEGYHGIADINKPCWQYCERKVTEVIGAPVRVTDDLDCNVDKCSITHINSVTITEGFDITLGASSPAGAEGNAVLTAGASFHWSKAQTTTDSYQFQLNKGESGYLVFRPMLRQSCGIFQQLTQWSSDDGFEIVCQTPVIMEDENACGRSPIKLDSGGAQGNFTFCYSATGVGC